MATQTEKATDPKAATPPPKAPAKKAASKKKAPAKKKAATSNASKKATAKASSAKANGKAATEAATEEEEDAGLPEMPEKDVKGFVTDINKLIAESTTTKTGNTWKAGKLLAELKTKCPDGQYRRITAERILDAEGKPLSRSWCTKAVRMYNVLPTNEKKAIKIGLGRLDQLCRLPLKAREDWINTGIEAVEENDEGEKEDVIYQVHELTVAELRDAVDQHLREIGELNDPTDQEVAVKDLQGIVKKLNKWKEDHLPTIRRKKFEQPQVETIEGCLETIGEFPQDIEVQAKKPRGKAKAKAAEG